MELELMVAPSAEQFTKTPNSWDAESMAAEKKLADIEVHPDWGLPPIRGLSYDEGFAVLDGQAQRRLNMSGEEFLRRWRAGDFSDEFKDANHSAFAALSILVRPFANDDSS